MCALLQVKSSPKKAPAQKTTPLESEIRSSLIRMAHQWDIDNQRIVLTKFSELLLLNGVISTQQMNSAMELIESIFEDKSGVLGACFLLRQRSTLVVKLSSGLSRRKAFWV
jgi:hypothetical protein